MLGESGQVYSGREDGGRGIWQSAARRMGRWEVSDVWWRLTTRCAEEDRGCPVEDGEGQVTNPAGCIRASCLFIDLLQSGCF